MNVDELENLNSGEAILRPFPPHLFLEVKMELVRFYALIVKIAFVLAALGMLKSCTLEVMGLAAQKTERGMMSYSRYTKMLTDR